VYKESELNRREQALSKEWNNLAIRSDELQAEKKAMTLNNH